MKVAVWDTYVMRTDNNLTMHFDILVPHDLEDRTQIREYGEQYLSRKDFPTEGIKFEKCQFCHVEQVPEPVEEEIQNFGYAIVELGNCK